MKGPELDEISIFKKMNDLALLEFSVWSMMAVSLGFVSAASKKEAVKRTSDTEVVDWRCSHQTRPKVT